MLEIKKELFDEEAGYKEYSIEILNDGEKIGRADVIVPPEEESDEDNVRCYERIAELYETNAPEVDQGFGVYYIG